MSLRSPPGELQGEPRGGDRRVSSWALFVLSMLFLGVSMSVSNIRHAARALPGTPGEGFRNGMHESFLGDGSSKGSPAEARRASPRDGPPARGAPKVFRASPPSLPPLSEVVPNSNNTVISIVSMGKLVDTYLVERCIRSVRRRGLFTGTILVFTDAVGYEHYRKSVLPWDSRTLILRGRDEDMAPRTGEEPGAPRIKYLQEKMIFKRFKTHHSKYLEQELSRSPVVGTGGSEVRYVVYIDADNVVGAPLAGFFEGYANAVATEYQRALEEHRAWRQSANANDTRTATPRDDEDDDFGFVGMFRDKHLRTKMHSGIIVYDLAFEDRCVNGWRNEMDTFLHASDQTIFLRVLENYDRYRCRAFALPHEYMAFASKRVMTGAMEARQNKRTKPLTLPTFVHITNFRVRRVNNATLHDEFVRYVLDLQDGEELMDGVRWEDVVPSDARRAGATKL